MIILGLTGSIAMGKSTVATMLQHMQIPVHDSDAAVHHLMKHNRELIQNIAKAFPICVTKKTYQIDRQALGKAVFSDPEKRKTLEALVHPLVRQCQQHFLAQCRSLKRPIAVLDIPLLYETGANQRCDMVMVVSAPFHIQRQRVLSRPNMTEEKFQRILSSQLSDLEKRKRADFVVPTGLGHAYSYRCVKKIIQNLK